MTTRIISAKSPHHSSRGGRSISGVVMHYTAGGSAASSVNWLQDERSRVSAHFVISRKGEIYQCVDIEHAAFHAGHAEMPMSTGETENHVNLRTIGIELANWGSLKKNLDGSFYGKIGSRFFHYHGIPPMKATLEYDTGEIISGWWEPYPDRQIDSLHEVLDYIVEQCGPNVADWQCGHEDIAMPLGRKSDPGPLFPWERLSRRVRRTKSIIEA